MPGLLQRAAVSNGLLLAFIGPMTSSVSCLVKCLRLVEVWTCGACAFWLGVGMLVCGKWIGGETALCAECRG